MNKYLVKVAAMSSDENKNVAKTFAIQTAAGIPAHAIGGAVGAGVGNKYLGSAAKKTGKALVGLGAKARSIPMIGKATSRYLSKARHLGGGTIGTVAGMAAAGGVADLLALKHGFHSKDKK